MLVDGAQILVLFLQPPYVRFGTGSLRRGPVTLLLLKAADRGLVLKPELYLTLAILRISPVTIIP